MLAENLQNWAKKERQEGRQEGETLLLTRLIKMKYGELPEWAQTKLDAATTEQLEAWSERILTADSLEALLKD